MRKITCYVWGCCVLLAGVSAVAADQDTSLPPAPLPPNAVVAANPANNRDPIPEPDAKLSVQSVDTSAPAASSSGPSNATVMAAPCPCEDSRHRCEYCHANCIGVKPLGACVAQHICAQVSNGVAAQMVLYKYDFNDPAIGDPAKLSPYGLRRLNQIARWLRAGNMYPVNIEPTIGSPALDAARQMHVITVLGESGLTPQVVVSDTMPGLLGAEALLVHVDRLQKFATGGAVYNRQTTDNTGTGSSGGGGGGSSSGGQGNVQ